MKNKKRNPLFEYIPYMKDAKKEYTLGFIFSIVNVMLGVGSVYILSKVFDGIGGTLTEQIIMKSTLIAIGYGIILICSGISSYIKNVYLIKGAAKVYVKIQTRVYDHIQNLPIKYFDNMPAGSVVSRITSDVNQIRVFFVSVFIDMIVISFKVLFSYMILFFVDYRFALVMVILVPIMIILLRFYNKIVYPSITGYRKKFTDSNSIINENYQNLEIIKAFGREDDSIVEWNKHNKERYVYWKKLNMIDSLMLHNIAGILKFIIFGGIIYYYAYSYFNPTSFTVTLGMVYLFLNYSTDIIDNITHMSMNISVYTRAVGASENINEILKLEVDKDIEMKDIADFRGNIDFKNVYFAYKEDDYVLKDINFQIEENKTIAFVGHTGSGKSTIMNLLVKFYSATKGNIYIGDRNIDGYSKEYLHSNTAIVLQDSFLFEGTLLENITSTGNRDLATASLIRVGGEFILNGRTLDSKVEVGGTNFSTGEKQLICLARALAKNPKILILDESTANIDSETEQYVGRAIEQLKQGRTTLIIAHRLSTIKNADCIYVLHKGEIVESGTHEQLIENNGRYKKMYETQIKG